MTLRLYQDEPEAEDAPLPGMIGEHPTMKAVYRLVRRVAATDLPVLITGETGTGKELVARAIHALSGRRGRFVAFNVCAVADTLFEAALFGHVKGAFTGAVADAPGYLLEADSGTVCLDEIGSMDLAAQGKLLRAIETKEFRPVGARGDRRSDFRVVAATNADLRELVAGGRFRRDLFERLHGVVVRLPALAERLTDVPPLAASFLRECADGRVRWTDEALAALQEHAWPGNVRELRNVVRRAASLHCGGSLDAALVQSALGGTAAAAGRTDVELPRSPLALERVLRAYRGNTLAAAQALGIGRSTLYGWLEKAGLKAKSFRNSG